jgi:putative sterol carrier protein
MAAEEGKVDVSAITPEQFAQMVKGASDEQIEDVVHGIGTDRTLQRIFAGFEDRFLPERAQGVDADIQFVVRDQGQEIPWVVAIHDGTCAASAGQADEAKVTLTSDLVPFTRMVAGQEDGTRLFMTGKLKVSGDLLFATRIMGFFERPSA